MFAALAFEEVLMVALVSVELPDAVPVEVGIAAAVLLPFALLLMLSKRLRLDCNNEGD